MVATVLVVLGQRVRNSRRYRGSPALKLFADRDDTGEVVKVGKGRHAIRSDYRIDFGLGGLPEIVIGSAGEHEGREKRRGGVTPGLEKRSSGVVDELIIEAVHLSGEKTD